MRKKDFLRARSLLIFLALLMNCMTLSSAQSATVDLGISKTIVDSNPVPGGYVTYQVTAVNNGPDMADWYNIYHYPPISCTGYMHIRFSPDQSSPECVNGLPNGYCRGYNLSVGETHSYNVTYSINSLTDCTLEYNYWMWVNGYGSDPTPSNDETPPAYTQLQCHLPECRDGRDNDGDGVRDYPDDPGCSDENDTTEDPEMVECSDGLDNDGDGGADMGGHPATHPPRDSDCEIRFDPNESCTSTQGYVNDTGGRVIPYETNYHNMITYDNKMWILGGYARQVLTSTDGAVWTSPAVDPLPADIYPQDAVVYDNKMWIIGKPTVQSGETGWRLYTSTDGITWTNISHNLPNNDYHQSGVYTNNARLVVFKNKLWILGAVFTEAENQARYYPRNIWVSGDGVNWSEVGVRALPFANYEREFVVFDGRIWMFARNGGAIVNILWTYNGEVWSEAGSEMLSPMFFVWNLKPTVFNNKMWVFGGPYNSRYGMFSSPDGLQWEWSGDSFPNVRGYDVTVYDGKLWMSGGSDFGGNPNHHVYYVDSQNFIDTCPNECDNNIDDDGDNMTDEHDLGCWADPTNSSTYNPLDDDEGDVNCSDTDGDGYYGTTAQCPIGDDCDDASALVNPGINEAGAQPYCFDDIDNDCDGTVDELDLDCAVDVNARAKSIQRWPGEVYRGLNFSYFIASQNTDGKWATNWTITDNIPPQLEFLHVESMFGNPAQTPNCTQVADKVVCNVDPTPKAPNWDIPFYLWFRVKDDATCPSTIVNTVNVSTAQIDMNPNDNHNIENASLIGRNEICGNGIDDDCDGLIDTDEVCLCYDVLGSGVCESPGDCDCLTEAFLDNTYCYSEVRLTEDIIDHAGTCMDVLYGIGDDDYKKLDCQNHQIDGVGSGKGISLKYAENKSIENCIIKDFDECVYLENPDLGIFIKIAGNVTSGRRNSLLLTNNEFKNCNTGAYFINMVLVNNEDNLIEDNVKGAIVHSDPRYFPMVGFSGSFNVDFHDNIIRNNSEIGLEVTGTASFMHVEGNTVIGNGVGLVMVNKHTSSIIESNNFSYNYQDGIRLITGDAQIGDPLINLMGSKYYQNWVCNNNQLTDPGYYDIYGNNLYNDSVDAFNTHFYNNTCQFAKDLDATGRDHCQYLCMPNLNPPVPEVAWNKNGSINLSWQPVSGAQSYEVLAADSCTLLSSDNFTTIETGVTNTNWIDANAASFTERYYKVAAVAGAQRATSTIIVGKVDVNLQPGWNLVSSPLSPASSSIKPFSSSVLSPLHDSGVSDFGPSFSGSYDFVVGPITEGSTVLGSFDPLIPSPIPQNLVNITEKTAFNIEMNRDDVLTLVGVLPNETIINFAASGWYWIGYPSCQRRDIKPYSSSVLSSLHDGSASDFGPGFDGNYDFLIGPFNGLMFLGTFDPFKPSGLPQNLGEMSPGRGYIIKVTGADTLITDYF